MNLSENEWLRDIILKRMDEVGLNIKGLLTDAEERGYPINRSTFSKWKHGKKHSLNDDNLIWIMERLGIKYNVNFGSPVVRNGKLIYEVDKYNELSALTRINILFGNGKKTNK